VFVLIVCLKWQTLIYTEKVSVPDTL